MWFERYISQGRTWLSLDRAKAYFFFLAGEGFRYVLTAAFAFVGAFLAALYADMQTTEQFRQNLNSRGIGYPAILFSAAEDEDPSLSVTFSPPYLQRLAVCEYYFDRQKSFRSLMEAYLEKYSSCMIPVWSTENAVEIRPNIFSGQLLETVSGNNRKFWCKCKPEQLPADEAMIRNE